MNISKKYIIKLIALGTAIAIIGIVGYILYPRDSKQTGYLFDKNRITLADVEVALKTAPIENYVTDSDAPPDETHENAPMDDQRNDQRDDQRDDQNINPRELFFQGKLINSRTTLNYFKHLEYLFRKSPDLEDHFEKTRAYLFAHFPPADAQLLFDTYQNYLKCEMNLTAEFKNLSVMTSPEEAIALLERIQASRRAQLGADLADTIFGVDVKTKEYALRRAQIVNNPELDGREKEMMLQQLNQDMWGADAQAVEERPEPYNRYQEKLDIYQKDIGSMDAADRQAKIQEFREEFFPPDVVEKMNEIDRQAATEQTTETQYHEAAKAISENPDLTDEEKHQQLTDLQNTTFGDQVDEFRRREAIEKGREAFIKEVEAKKDQAGTNGE